MSVWLSDPSKGPVRRSTAASTTVAPFTITASLQFDPGAALHPRQPQRSLGLQALALGKRAPSFAHMCSRHPGRRIFSTSLAQSRPHDPPPGPSTSRLSLVNACDRTPAPARTAPPHSASGFAPSLSLNPPPLSPLLWGLSHSQLVSIHAPIAASPRDSAAPRAVAQSQGRHLPPPRFHAHISATRC